MTSRPQSVRMRHLRAKQRSAVSLIASLCWLLSGIGLVWATDNAWWAWSFVLIGAALLSVFFVLLPRLRRARQQLRHVEDLQDAQHQALVAQREARMRAFDQPVIRSPFPSSS